MKASSISIFATCQPSLQTKSLGVGTSPRSGTFAFHPSKWWSNFDISRRTAPCEKNSKIVLGQKSRKTRNYTESCTVVWVVCYAALHHKRHHKMDDQCSQRHPCSANRLAPSTPQRNLDQHCTILHLRWASSEFADTSVTRVTVATMLLRADHPVGLKCLQNFFFMWVMPKKKLKKDPSSSQKKRTSFPQTSCPSKTHTVSLSVSGASPPRVSPETAAAACANFCLMVFVRSEST